MCALHTLKVGKIMKIKKQDGPPEDLLYFDEEVDLTPCLLYTSPSPRDP